MIASQYVVGTTECYVCLLGNSTFPMLTSPIHYLRAWSKSNVQPAAFWKANGFYSCGQVEAVFPSCTPHWLLLTSSFQLSRARPEGKDLDSRPRLGRRPSLLGSFSLVRYILIPLL
jgi:hypothetical protein